MKKILDILSNAWKYTIAIAGFGGIIWGGYKIYDTIIDTQDMVVDVWTQQGILETKMDHGLGDIQDSLERIENKVEGNSDAIWVLKRQFEYEREHRSEYTQEQLNQQLREIEELIKKNGSPTVYNRPGETLSSNGE